MLIAGALLPSLLALTSLAADPPDTGGPGAVDGGPPAAAASEAPSEDAAEDARAEPSASDDEPSAHEEAPKSAERGRAASPGNAPPPSPKPPTSPGAEAEGSEAPSPPPVAPPPASAAAPASPAPASPAPASPAPPPAVPKRALDVEPAAGALGTKALEPEELARRAAASVTRLYVERGEMTVEAVGFFVAPDVLAVPHHALELGRRVFFVRPTTGERVEAAGVVAADATEDLALLQLAEPEDVEPLLPVAEEPRLGQAAFLVGVDKRGALVFVDARVAVTGPTGARLAIPEGLSLPGAPVLDGRGRVIGRAGLGAPVDGLRPAGGARPLRALMAAVDGAPQPLVVWSKAADRSPVRDEAEKVAAASTFTSTAACLTACGTFLCGVPIALGFAAFAVVGCGVVLAVFLGGAALLTDVLQVLFPSAVVALLVPSAGGALALFGLAGAATASGAAVAGPLALGAAGLVAREVVAEEPWHARASADAGDAQAY